MPQEQRVVLPFTVAEKVHMGRTPYRWGWAFESQLDCDVVEWVLECTGTSNLAAMPFQHLCSGEKQRVIIARAIAQRSKTLLLDEFTASLIVRYQLELDDMVDRVSRLEEPIDRLTSAVTIITVEEMAQQQAVTVHRCAEVSAR
jgi:ABC-type cobalamin/Fe3+-siderophores transport system ATPase subunit